MAINGAAIAVARNSERFMPVERMSALFADLPELLLLLGGSALNQAYFDELDEQTAEGGKLEGQSKATPDDDALIDVPPVQTEFTRPNGEVYYSRDWTGFQDVQVLRTAREHNMFAFLYSLPGTGKTSLCEAAFGVELLTVIFTADTLERDLVGQWLPNPAYGKPSEPEYVWMDGPLIIAALEGRPLLADEIALGDPKVLSVIYGLMDGRRELVVLSNPDRGIIKAAPGFFVIGATNPNVPGANMSDALLSRFPLHVEMTTDWTLAVDKLGISEKITGVAESLSKQVRLGEIEWAPQMRELIAFRDQSAVFGDKFAASNLIAAAPKDLRAHVQAAVRRHYGDALAARI